MGDNDYCLDLIVKVLKIADKIPYQSILFSKVRFLDPDICALKSIFFKSYKNFIFEKILAVSFTGV